MLKNDTLKNGTSRIGYMEVPPPGAVLERVPTMFETN